MPPKRRAASVAPPEQDPPVRAGYPLDDTDTPPSLGKSSDAGTTDFLAKFLKLTPFLDLHERALKISGGEHVGRERLCFFFDGVIRLLVVSLMLAIVAAVAWKTLAPLPEFTVSN